MSDIENRLSKYVLTCCGKDYKSPKKIEDEVTKSSMESLYRKSLSMIDLFYDLVDKWCKEINMVYLLHNGVLDGTRRKIRKYLWAELKDISYLNCPVSISLFVEPNKADGNVYFRISLEINEKNSSSKEIKKFNEIIMSMNLPSGFCYGFTKKNTIKVEFVSDLDELKEKKYYKLQICKSVNANNANAKEIVNTCIAEIKPMYKNITIAMLN